MKYDIYTYDYTETRYVPPRRPNKKWMLWLGIGILVVLALSSCGHYQPPGGELWKMV